MPLTANLHSTYTQRIPDNVLSRKFDYSFSLELLNKDVQVCVIQPPSKTHHHNCCCYPHHALASPRPRLTTPDLYDRRLPSREPF